jgi:hypothetical protein
MNKRKFSAYIDKLTRSIENVRTGEILKTQILLTSINDLKKITRKEGWNFNWKMEAKKETSIELYKLVTVNEPEIIQGLVSCIKRDGYYNLPLIESAPFNIGRKKEYAGVAGNLVAFICKLSFEAGFEGVVSFTPKTILKDHYKLTLGAEEINKTDLAIFTKAARILVNLYYENN